MRIFTVLFCLCSFSIWAQTTADFENLNPGENSYNNNSGNAGLFTSGNFAVKNNYFENGMYSTGFNVSTVTDTQTRGFTNQYSCISGAGAEGTATYLSAFAFDPARAYTINEAEGGVVKGMYINNATYAYYSMLEGDGIAKRFGGIDGTDPDYFLLTIEAYNNGSIKSEKVEFYLADFRSDDPSEDYIINEWKWVDLESLGDVDSLLFSLSSTDIGNYGMNTPAYFCIDQIVTSDVSSIGENLDPIAVNVYPNPTSDFINISVAEANVQEVQIVDITGRSVRSEFDQSTNRVALDGLKTGIYFVHVRTENKAGVARIQVIGGN